MIWASLDTTKYLKQIQTYIDLTGLEDNNVIIQLFKMITGSNRVVWYYQDTKQCKICNKKLEVHINQHLINNECKNIKDINMNDEETQKQINENKSVKIMNVLQRIHKICQIIRKVNLSDVKF